VADFLVAVFPGTMHVIKKQLIENWSGVEDKCIHGDTCVKSISRIKGIGAGSLRGEGMN